MAEYQEEPSEIPGNPIPELRAPASGIPGKSAPGNRSGPGTTKARISQAEMPSIRAIASSAPYGCK